MNDPVDLIKPWSIKSVATRTQNIVSAAARRDNLTVGQWLEKRIDEWEASGSPEPRGAPSLTELAALITAAAAMAQHTELPEEVRSLIANLCARAAQDLHREPENVARVTKADGQCVVSWLCHGINRELSEPLSIGAAADA